VTGDEFAEIAPCSILAARSRHTTLDERSRRHPASRRAGLEGVRAANPEASLVRSAFTIVVLIGLLGACAGVALWVWQEIGEVEIGVHGLIALGLGAGLTFLLGAGLMALMFFSARRGYDDRAHEAEQTHADHWRPPDED
jgi:hypothetical protein